MARLPNEMNVMQERTNSNLEGIIAKMDAHREKMEANVNAWQKRRRRTWRGRSELQWR
jgi:hypothetical protein